MTSKNYKNMHKFGSWAKSGESILTKNLVEHKSIVKIGFIDIETEQKIIVGVQVKTRHKRIELDEIYDSINEGKKKKNIFRMLLKEERVKRGRLLQKAS